MNISIFILIKLNYKKKILYFFDFIREKKYI